MPSMRQRHSCISHGSNVEGAILFENTMRCGLGMQQCAMHSATIQKATFFELGVQLCTSNDIWACLDAVSLDTFTRL